MKVVNRKNDQSHREDQLIEVAPPQKDHYSFESPFFLDSFHFPELEKLKLDPMAQ